MIDYEDPALCQFSPEPGTVWQSTAPIIWTIRFRDGTQKQFKFTDKLVMEEIDEEHHDGHGVHN